MDTGFEFISVHAKVFNIEVFVLRMKFCIQFFMLRGNELWCAIGTQLGIDRD